jgi:hypothetical protein
MTMARKKEIPRLSFREAVTNHKAAKAAPDRNADDNYDDLDALDGVAESLCADDAEFLEKLRYLLAEEIEIECVRPGQTSEAFKSIAAAADFHLNPDKAVRLARYSAAANRKA